MGDAMKSAKGIKRITIVGASGFVSRDMAVRERFTVSADSISYVLKPRAEDSVLAPRSWSYKTDRADFQRMYLGLCEELITLFRRGDVSMANDAGTVAITASFTDGSHERHEYDALPENLGGLFGTLDKMRPPCEEPPIMGPWLVRR